MDKTCVDEHLKRLGTQELNDIEPSSDIDSNGNAQHLFKFPMMVDGKAAKKIR